MIMEIHIPMQMIFKCCFHHGTFLTDLHFLTSKYVIVNGTYATLNSTRNTVKLVVLLFPFIGIPLMLMEYLLRSNVGE